MRRASPLVFLLGSFACGDGGVADDAGVEASSDVASPDVHEAGAPVVLLPDTGIVASELGVLVNDDDPLSVQVAAYYVSTRAIPAQNVVHLHVWGDAGSPGASIAQNVFAPLKAQVDSALGPDVQAMLLTWTQPFRVESMAITSAFALGFKAIADTCDDPNAQALTPNPYSKKPASTKPFTDLGFRPAMLLPATSFADAKALIDKGKSADDTWPAGSAYLMSTSDGIRSARCIYNANYGWTNECQQLLDVWDSTQSKVAASIVSADEVKDAPDVLFYVQGLASVADVATNTYLPGAVADHLTSFGGEIPTSGQMSAIVWLQAGATGSFGTVVEPCAYTQKFPNPRVLVPAYFGGATLVEAYWKSVAWPAEGIFLGDPLARPWGTGFHTSFAGGTLTITTTTMVPTKTYMIDAADVQSGPFDVVTENLSTSKYGIATFTVPNATRAFYRFHSY